MRQLLLFQETDSGPSREAECERLQRAIQRSVNAFVRRGGDIVNVNLLLEYVRLRAEQSALHEPAPPQPPSPSPGGRLIRNSRLCGGDYAPGRAESR